MMKKKSLNIFYVFILGISIYVLLSIPAKQSNAAVYGNKVTCYSTYTLWEEGDTQYSIYDCGPCTSVQCSAYSDVGHCYHKVEDNGGAVN